MEKIDELDRKILRVITQNARTPFKDVAEICGVSRAAVHQRVQKMFENGVIIGSAYNIQPKSMYRSVCAELEKIPEVVEAQYTLGAYSMLIKVFAKDDQHLMRLLNSQIQSIPGVANTETLTALEQSIYRALPIE